MEREFSYMKIGIAMDTSMHIIETRIPLTFKELEIFIDDLDDTLEIFKENTSIRINTKGGHYTLKDGKIEKLTKEEKRLANLAYSQFDPIY